MIEARFARAPAIFVVAPAGESDQLHGQAARRGPQLPGNFIPVDARKPDIAQHDLGSEVIDLGERFVSVMGSTDLMSETFQQKAQDPSRIRMIVHDQHATRPGSGAGACGRGMKDVVRLQGSPPGTALRRFGRGTQRALFRLSAQDVGAPLCERDHAAARFASFSAFFFLLGRVPINLQMMPSMISSAPPPMEMSRESRYARATCVSHMKPWPPQN